MADLISAAALSSQVRFDFANTRGDRFTGSVSYDVDITNIGSEASLRVEKAVRDGLSL